MTTRTNEVCANYARKHVVFKKWGHNQPYIDIFGLFECQPDVRFVTIGTTSDSVKCLPVHNAPAVN